jgi:hypothetical protein
LRPDQPRSCPGDSATQKSLSPSAPVPICAHAHPRSRPRPTPISAPAPKPCGYEGLLPGVRDQQPRLTSSLPVAVRPLSRCRACDVMRLPTLVVVDRLRGDPAVSSGHASRTLHSVRSGVSFVLVVPTRVTASRPARRKNFRSRRPAPGYRSAANKTKEGPDYGHHGSA